jgi:hypothetical protein
MLPVQPPGPVTVQLTAVLKLPVPLTTALNCRVAPMVAVAGFGVTTTEVMAEAV